MPSGRNTGFSCDTRSKVVPGRGPSSAATTVPLGRVTGVMSCSQKPLVSASLGPVLAAHPELVLGLAADAADLGHVLRRLAHGDVHVGQAAVAPGVVSTPRRRRGPAPAVAASAWANTGFWVSGRPSEDPFTNRLTVSTPAAMNTSPSPALMAWKAMRVVCRLEAQYRVTVVPGSRSKPNRTATTRARL